MLKRGNLVDRLPLPGYVEADTTRCATSIDPRNGATGPAIYMHDLEAIVCKKRRA